MAIIKNKILYVKNDDGRYTPFYTVNSEIFLTAELNMSAFNYQNYATAILSPISKKIIRLYILNDDETIKEDVSEYVISWSLNFNYQQGVTRSCSFELFNGDGFWNINPLEQKMWRGMKFRFDIGLFYNGVAYWKKCGIFTPSNPSRTSGSSNKKISVQMEDKFALLNGTSGGKQAHKIKIPVGTPIKRAIEICLTMLRGNNKPYDIKPLIFPVKYKDEVTPYTIDQAEDSNIGDIIIELANMISCDVFYNDEGNLVLEEGVDTIYYEYKPIQWTYDKNNIEYADIETTYNYAEVVNKVIVKGAIRNGNQFSGTAVNDNPKSQTNVYMNDIYTYLLTDNMITSNKLCLDRAKYELKKKTMLGLKMKFKSVFIPHLLHNHLVKITNPELNIKDKKFVIQSISINSDSLMLMDISLCNVDEINI